MVNLNEEIQKFEPILDVEELEASIREDEIQDVMDLLNYIVNEYRNK